MGNKLDYRQLVWIGTGHVIGAGVVSIVGSALNATGNSVWLAFLTACILSFIRILPVIFFTSAVAVEGGRYGMITRCAGIKYGGMVTLSSLLNWSARGTAVVALSSYIEDFMPFVNSRAVTVSIWTFFCIANLFGLDVMSRIQQTVTPLLLCALGIFSAVCIVNTRSGYVDFASGEMFVNGIGGFFTAVVLLSYSCDGIASLANYSCLCERPTVNIPRAMVTVSALTTAIYVAVGYASGSVLPLEQTAGKTLIVTARYVLPGIWFYMFVILGPIFALVTTMNAGIPDSILPVMAGAYEGWLPKWLTKQNRYGAYPRAIGIIYIIGALPVIARIPVTQIASTTIVLGALSAVLIIISAANFPFVYPVEWKKSKLYISLPIYFAIISVCAAIELFMVLRALSQLSITMIMLNICLMLTCLYYGFHKKTTNK